MFGREALAAATPLEVPPTSARAVPTPVAPARPAPPPATSAPLSVPRVNELGDDDDDDAAATTMMDAQALLAAGRGFQAPVEDTLPSARHVAPVAPAGFAGEPSRTAPMVQPPAGQPVPSPAARAPRPPARPSPRARPAPKAGPDRRMLAVALLVIAAGFAFMGLGLALIAIGLFL